ncbi:plasmid partitioning protein RepA [Ensifer sp. YR511]|uniref:plasmid partitioning protein RepA n=1 Tax=Ensifer sp. YR511 TaxID=1855294 RepID=UPI00088BA66C|nr:plasmid partitioning protein RepA [Ensifer sp. YR511]SDN97295.1 chromosome partitioning protein [Ensifer sp. YR511]
MATPNAVDVFSQANELLKRPVGPWLDEPAPVHVQTAADAALLSSHLSGIRQRLLSPTSKKRLRTFSSGEAARLIGVSDGYLRQLSLSGDGPQPSSISLTRRRSYTLEDVNALRAHLAAHGSAKAKYYLPHRNPKAGEQLQILAVANCRAASGKTTTATYLAQYMALQGYRVLAIDLDAQASMSTLLGYQPELDLNPNASIYGAIRCDVDHVPLASVILKTYFPGLDLCPGHLELQEFEHATPRNLAPRKAGETNSAEAQIILRLRSAIATVADNYDVVILDCPPQLGYLTLAGLCAATGVIVTVNPQMLQIASMSQFLSMISDLLSVVLEAVGEPNSTVLRYLITQHEPNDGLQTQIVAFLRAQFGERVLTAPMIKSPAISEASLIKQTLYETGRDNSARVTFDRAMESLTAVNSQIENLIKAAWGRAN